MNSLAESAIKISSKSLQHPLKSSVFEESSTLPRHSTPSETEKIKELRYRQGIVNEMNAESQSILIRLFINSKLRSRHGVFPSSIDFAVISLHYIFCGISLFCEPSLQHNFLRGEKRFEHFLDSGNEKIMQAELFGHDL
jgi:hypothetical protein